MLLSMVESRLSQLFLLPEWGAERRERKIFAAVSGGVDSMALLKLLLELRTKLDFSLSVAHVDHGLRASSAGDADFVRGYCEKQSIACFVRRLGAVPDGENVEDWCRRERYLFFSELLAQENAFAVCTAHHANDVLETFVMRMLANKEARGIQAADLKRRVIRPLLGARRADLEAYVAQGGLDYVEDETNAQTAFVRNRVRNVLLPFVEEKFGAAAVDSLLLRAQASSADEDLLLQLAEERLREVRSLPFGTRDWVRKLREVIEPVPPEFAWRIVERAFHELVPYRIGRLKALELAEVVCHRQVAAQLPGGVEVRRSEGAIIVRAT
jgi:tRNA(Ile)-lysidine synthetase-like protein